MRDEQKILTSLSVLAERSVDNSWAERLVKIKTHQLLDPGPKTSRALVTGPRLRHQ